MLRRQLVVKWWPDWLRSRKLKLTWSTCRSLSMFKAALSSSTWSQQNQTQSSLKLWPRTTCNLARSLSFIRQLLSQLCFRSTVMLLSACPASSSTINSATTRLSAWSRLMLVKCVPAWSLLRETNKKKFFFQIFE